MKEKIWCDNQGQLYLFCGTEQERIWNRSVDLLGIMAFTVRPDKQSHFVYVICCDQWKLLGTVSNQRCLEIWIPGRLRSQGSVCLLLCKHLHSLHIELVYQVVLMQSALFSEKKKKLSRLIFDFSFSFSQHKVAKHCSDLSPLKIKFS